jgi:hypothetical protein
MIDRERQSLKLVWQVMYRDARDPELQKVKDVGWGLSSRWGSDANDAFPSVETLAGDSGCGETKARRGLRILERLGWIVCVERGGGRNKTSTYAASLPETQRVARGLDAERVRELQERGRVARGLDQETQRVASETQRLASENPTRGVAEGGRKEDEKDGLSGQALTHEHQRPRERPLADPAEVRAMLIEAGFLRDVEAA